MQSQKAVSAHFTNNHMMHFGFAGKYCCLILTSVFILFPLGIVLTARALIILIYMPYIYVQLSLLVKIIMLCIFAISEYRNRAYIYPSFIHLAMRCDILPPDAFPTPRHLVQK